MAHPMPARIEGLEVIAANLAGAMSAYARATAQGSVTELPGGMVLVDSGVNYAVFNAAVLPRRLQGGEEALERLLRLARDHYGERKRGWSCWLCEELLDPDVQPRVRQIFARHRLRPIVEHHGMLAERLEPSLRKLPPLSIRRVDDVETRHAFSQLMSRVFALPEDVSRRVYGAPSFWSGSYVAWIGYAGRRAVTTAATEPAGGALGLYSVATLPEEQGKGYAEAVSRHGIEAAQRASGFTRYVLQSTRVGLPLYHRMGFRRLTRLSVYATA